MLTPCWGHPSSLVLVAEIDTCSIKPFLNTHAHTSQHTHTHTHTPSNRHMDLLEHTRTHLSTHTQLNEHTRNCERTHRHTHTYTSQHRRTAHPASGQTKALEPNPQTLSSSHVMDLVLPTSLTYLLLWASCWNLGDLMRLGVRQGVRQNMYIYKHINIYISVSKKHVSMHVSAHCVVGRTCLQLRLLYSICKSISRLHMEAMCTKLDTHTHICWERDGCRRCLLSCFWCAAWFVTSFRTVFRYIFFRFSPLLSQRNAHVSFQSTTLTFYHS